MLMRYGLIICIVAWISLCSADDVVVQMFSKKPINVISDKYISYSVDPTELLEMNQDREENFLYRMMESGPCYLKIYGNNTNKMRLDGDSIDLNSSKLPLDRLKSVYEVLRAAGIRPVIALPYDPKRWNTRNVMRILGKVSMLEMNDITWQLGADFRAEDAISYIDDLNTLKLIVGAFSTKKNRKNWSVVGSDLTLGSSEDEARMYSEFSKYTVDAVGWSQSIELSYSDENMDDFFSSLNIDPSLRTLLNGDAPVWLSLLQKNRNIDFKNPLAQMKHGLNWAQTLGDAARNGFKVIYAPINKQTWYEPSMSYYTTLLHKRIIGQTVFDTKMFNGNRFDSHFYAHCTKNMSGSFTIFGVNAADSALDITAKLPFRSGTQFVEFVLTVGLNGKVFLNGAEIIEPTVLTPQARVKLPGKGAVFSMPAHSVAFWVFTGATIPECASVDTIEFDLIRSDDKSSSERLLQHLILETIARDENITNTDDENSIKRTKRHAIFENITPNNRIRRNMENHIDKHAEYNAIELNELDSEHEPHDERFKRGLANLIYNEVDDIKRRNLLAPYKNRVGLPAKRMKRDINMLKNLFDKFDLKKPAFNFKTPSLKFGAKSLIPSITTVHDVLNPGADVHNQEKKLFEPIENPEFPSGDVHFELAESLPSENEYAAAIAAGTHVVSQFPEETPSVHVSNPAVDIYSNAGVPMTPQLTNVVPSPVLLGELSEIDAKSNLVTVAPVPAPAPVLAPNTAQTPSEHLSRVQPIQPVQHQLQYVVKDLPPTWQVNLQNMEKARTNLRQNLWPMSTNNAQSTSAKIAAFLPNVAQTLNVQPQQDVEHVFFESRRRRRAINDKFNDEIEKRLARISGTTTSSTAKNDLRLDTAIDQVELLDKMLRLFDDLERNQNTVLKNNDGIRKLLSKRLRGDASEKDAPKKCKVLSMAMEQQCLQTENQAKPIFKRAADRRMKPTGPLKKFFSKIKETVESPLKFRNKRSLFQPMNSDESSMNEIPRERVHEKVEQRTPRKYIYQKHYYAETTPYTTSTSTSSTTETVSDSHKSDQKAPKILRRMKGYVNNITNSVMKHVGRWWFALA